MNYKLLSTKNAIEWRGLLEKLPSSSQDVYFTPEYYSLYESLGDGAAQCFVYEEEDNIVLYPFLINSINSLGYNLDKEYYDIQGAYGYNGIVTNCKTDTFIEKFWNIFELFCIENQIVAEFTRLHPFISDPNIYRRTHSVIFDRKTIFFNLQKSDDEVFEAFQYSTKRQIKRATNRFGIKLEIEEQTQNNLNNLIKIYHGTMNRAEATDYLYFNDTYFKELVSLNNSVQFIAMLEGKPIGVIFGIYSKDFFHGHLSGSIREYMHMSPSSFLYWEMFKYAKNKGCKVLHLGGGDSPEEDNPLLKFKTNFSKDSADFYIAKKIHNEEVYKEVVKQWELKYPEKVNYLNRLLLKYRY